MSPTKIKIAARHSDLARLQAYRVGDALRSAHPGLVVEYSFRASLGDQNLQDPLWKMPEKGVFTEDFVRDLQDGSADLVVHSWKDLPTDPRPDLTIAATMPRADQRDLFLFRRDRSDRARTDRRLRVLTSSPRRAYNLDAFFRVYLPFEIRDVVFENVRGNIPTRLRKLLDGESDSLIVAKAAVDRLLEAPESEFTEARQVVRDTLLKTRQMVLPLSLNPTAAAQGALAVEIRRDREDLAKLLKPIHCAATFAAVVNEREILSSHGGGCHQKIGVSILDRSYGRVTYLQGLTDAGVRLNQVALETPVKVSACAALEFLYPQEEEPLSFFVREALPRSAWAMAENAKHLWVSRENAWPVDFRSKNDAIIWTAGLKTWAKLAKKGVWVSGTADGLGEREDEGFGAISKAIFGQESRWTKLSHSESAGRAQRELSETTKKMSVLATYRLVPSHASPDLTQRTHFYWMSGTAFDQAVSLDPTLLERGVHASGPGQTHDYLKTVLLKSTPLVYLSVDQFRRAALVSFHGKNS